MVGVWWGELKNVRSVHFNSDGTKLPRRFTAYCFQRGWRVLPRLIVDRLRANGFFAASWAEKWGIFAQMGKGNEIQNFSGSGFQSITAALVNGSR
jgi:hypothetical protein